MLAKIKLLAVVLVSALSMGTARADRSTDQSVNGGIFHPNGSNLIGYSVEGQLDDRLYWFYAFGFPTVAAIGLTWYEDRNANGLTGTIGTSLGAYAYGSVAYQVSLGNRNYLKLGVGAWAVVDYGGDLLPVIAFEHRF